MTAVTSHATPLAHSQLIADELQGTLVVQCANRKQTETRALAFDGEGSMLLGNVLTAIE